MGELLGNNDPSPLTDRDFARLMDALGPFEPRPLLAVAVSGGADSLALALLAERWARARRGRIAALTVDHRLRPESAAEARQVGRWLRARGIAHRILVWEEARPAGDLQAAAREARYRLLEAWCRDAGCLHLLTAHHREDQAETFWLRLARGSGLDGLAGIAGVSERGACRILRPLLPVAPERLRALLRSRRQAWIEDPSNENRAFARVRIREARALVAAEGLGAERLGETMRHLGDARAALETETAGLLARAVRIDPAGLAFLDMVSLLRAPREIGLRALAAVLTTIGGSDYPPRLARLRRFYDEFSRNGLGQGRTLGGCRVAAWGETALVCREAAGLQERTAIAPGGRAAWDRRFQAALSRNAPRGLTLGALGLDRRGLPPAARKRLAAVPAAARPTLPALRDKDGSLVALPGIGWAKPRVAELVEGWIRFRPPRQLAPLGFTVV
jgi:tRNA(Ile)-lysidine synthase